MSFDHFPDDPNHDPGPTVRYNKSGNQQQEVLKILGKYCSGNLLEQDDCGYTYVPIDERMVTSNEHAALLDLGCTKHDGVWYLNRPWDRS
jgi:hypothetical protein